MFPKVKVWKVKLLLLVSGGLFGFRAVRLLQLSNDRNKIMRNNKKALLKSERNELLAPFNVTNEPPKIFKKSFCTRLLRITLKVNIEITDF